MAQKPTQKAKSKLLSWFFNEPAKFALMSFGLMAGVVLIYALIAGLVTGGTGTLNPLPIVILVTAALVFSICKYISWLPKDNLDRKSFVAIDNGLTFIYYISLLLSTIFIVSSAQKIMLYAMWLQYYSMFWFFTVVIAASIIYMYVFGLLIGNMYATYRRALAMGVPRFKALLTVPFSTAMFWFPGYLLTDETRAKPVVEIKTKWYSKLTDWVVAKPLNAILLFLLTLAFSALFFDLYTLGLTLFFGAIFCVWVLITGTKTFKKNIGGAYSTVAGALNIAFIIICISAAAFYSSNSQTAMEMQTQEIQVTEVTE